MSENKRYYWLKLSEGFFEDDTISWIEEQKNGKEYCLFYLKLCLKSLKTNGLLIRNVGEVLVPYDAKKLAELTNTDHDTVVVAMELFKLIGLIRIFDNGEIFLTQLSELVGSETDRAKAMRAKRTRERVGGNNVTQIFAECSKMLPEKEIDIELEKEKEIETTTGAEDDDKHLSTILCGQILTTADELAQVTDFANRVIHQFWQRPATDDDIIQGFEKCHRIVRRGEDDIGIFDEHKGQMLSYAISLAAEKGAQARNWYYVNAIYANWERLELRSLYAVTMHELERSQQWSAHT